MNQLEALGFGPYFSAQLELLGQPGLVPARVVADGRGQYPLAGCSAPYGEMTGKLQAAISAGDEHRPAVGDWVLITEQPGRAVIHHVLDRRTELRRRAAGSETAGQVIAANVDVFFIVTAAGRDLNLRRLERYLTAVWDSGAAPVVVLNKADLAEDVALLVAAIEPIAPAVPVIAVSALAGTGLAELNLHLGPGVTGAFVGSSGVGKSSLTNCILGATQAVSATGAEGKGRHTTTRRELFVLPGGGALIDTPGLREFGMFEHSAGLDAAFSDVAALAEACRFADCRHAGDPGCALELAVANQSLPAERLASYLALKRESAAAEARKSPAQASNSKQRWKIIHKAQRAHAKTNAKRR